MGEKGRSDTQFIVKNIYKDQTGEMNAEIAKSKLLDLIRNAMISETNQLGRLPI